MVQPRKSPVRFREREELLDFLLEVSRITSESLDLDKLLENVAAIVKNVVPYDLFAILLFSERTQGLSIRYSIGHREEVVRSLIIPLNEGVTGVAAATRTPILVDDVTQDPRYLNALDAVRSELSVPMMARGKLVGVIDLQSTRVKAYTEQDRSLIRLIAARVGASIENARLYSRVNRQNRALRTLSHLSQEFSSLLDLDELLTKIAATVRTFVNYDAFGVFLVDREHEQGVLRHRFSARFDERVHLDNIPLGKGITGAAVEARVPVRVADTGADARYIAQHPNIRSELAVPLIVQDRVVGVLDVESERMAFFTEDHQRILTLLAPQIASSVENARLYEELAQRERRMDEDLKAARKLQRVLLPRHAPAIPGLEAGIRSRPARDVSGDLYDFFEQGADRTLIAFGDVSGKGASAALYGALVSGLLRILAPQHGRPGDLIKTLNEQLMERRVDAQYATLLIAQWERKRNRLTFANAGAEPPFIFRRGEVLKPRVEGVPIGLLEDREYEEVEFVLEPGDTILFYSDGVEDQLNAKEEDYSRTRVQKLLTKRHAESPQAIADSFIAELDKFRGSTPITDDQTVVALRLHA
ncbi:MAG TPA: SpoIIE family protein phosphatase [Bryobacteraceae bacterium]|jgi:sigma-B regulation protein RsbU (phosphoserine phosphatase)